jgi:hypothetical protein
MDMFRQIARLGHPVLRTPTGPVDLLASDAVRALIAVAGKPGVRDPLPGRDKRARARVRRYTTGLHPINVGAPRLNVAIVLVYVVQTHI